MKIRTKSLGVIGLAALLLVVAGVTNNPPERKELARLQRSEPMEFLEVSGDQMVGALSRTEIRPVVSIIPPEPPGIPPNTIITTFEVIDSAANKTILFYHPPGPCNEGRVND
jgi:hypothetical protein